MADRSAAPRVVGTAGVCLEKNTGLSEDEIASMHYVPHCLLYARARRHCSSSHFVQFTVMTIDAFPRVRYTHRENIFPGTVHTGAWHK
jgi:hypothetical protein